MPKPKSTKPKRETIVIRTEKERKAIFPKLKRTKPAKGKKMKPVLAWAVYLKGGELVNYNLTGAYGVYETKADALRNGYPWEIIRVRISQV